MAADSGENIDRYSFQGYPVSEVKNRYGAQPYRLEPHEQHSIREIKAILNKKNGYRDREMVEQHLSYLESLSKKLTLILASEEREGVMNLELRQVVADIRGCCLQLTKKLDLIREESY